MKKTFLFLLLSSLLLTGCTENSASNRNPDSSIHNSISEKATEEKPSLSENPTFSTPSDNPSSSKPEESASSKDTSVNKPKTVTVFSINDIHGSLEPYVDPDYGNKELGIARLAYAIKNDEDYDPNTSIILSSGDSWQGGYLAHEDRSLTDKLLGELGVKARAVGNHEFDAGLDKREERSKKAPYPYLGLNIVNSQGEIPSFRKKSTIIDQGNVRYGVIGVIDSNIEDTIRAGAMGEYTFSDSRTLISSERDALYQQGCDLVLLSAHADKDSRYIQSIGNTFLPNKLNGIFGGHSHRFQNVKVGTHQIPYVQGGCNSRGYAKRTFDLTTKKATKEYYVNASIYYNTSDSLCQRDILNTLKDANSAHPTHELATFQDTLRKENELHNFIPQVRIDYGKSQGLGEEKTGRKIVAIHNLGGIRSSIPEGVRTEKELFKFSPFDNLVVKSREVKGSQIRSSIGKDTGNNVTGYYCYRVEGKAALDSSATYDVITIDFVSTSSYWKGDKPFFNITSDNSELFIRDRYKNYFLSKGDNPVFSASDFE